MNRLGLSLPGPLDRTFEHMQGAVTPCALFSLGASLTRCRIAGGLAEPLFAVAAKNVLMPVLVWSLAVHVYGLPSAWSQAAILLAAMPTGVNVYLFAARYAAAKDLATTTVFLSTTFSLLSVSVVLYLLQTLGETTRGRETSTGPGSLGSRSWRRVWRKGTSAFWPGSRGAMSRALSTSARAAPHCSRP